MSGAEAGPPAHLGIAGLVKRFGAFLALDRVDLAVARGELLTLLGPSGCGKTTLLRVIAGFLAPEAGTLRLGERPLDGVPPEARNFGMVFQSYAVFPHLSVADNVGYGLSARGVPRAEAGRRIAEALARVRLEALAARFPDALSGGQKQRVGLARAMVISPDLLLMDEPLSNLDAKLRIEMRTEIRRMQKELGITTIYVTHDQEEALAISDRIAVMDRGRILQLGAPREIFERPAHAFVAEFVGGCNWFAARREAGAIRLGAGELRAALRTEDLRTASAADPPEHCIEGVVESLSYLGPRTRLRLALEDGAVAEADLPSDAPMPGEGAAARLAFDPARVMAFAPDGTRLP